MNDKNRYIGVSLLLFISVLVLYWHILYTPQVSYDPQKVFPSSISEWMSEDIVYDKVIIDILSPDRVVYKEYNRQGSVPVTLFIAFYSSMEKADLSHSPIVCFTGQGWDLINSSKVNITVNQSNTKEILVDRLIQKKAGTTMITLFWYQSADHAFNNRGIQKLYLLLNRLLGKTDRNAFVRINASISNGKDIDQLKSDLSKFVYDSYPEIRRFTLEK